MEQLLLIISVFDRVLLLYYIQLCLIMNKYMKLQYKTWFHLSASHELKLVTECMGDTCDNWCPMWVLKSRSYNSEIGLVNGPEAYVFVEMMGKSVASDRWNLE